MTTQRWTGLALVATLGILVGACATITYDADLIEGIVAMNRITETGGYERVGTFEETKKVVFVIADLVTLIDADLEDLVGDELSRYDGDAVINITIHEEDDPVDVLVGLIASGWVSTRTVTIRGDVVRWSGEDEDRSRLLAHYCRPVEVSNPDRDRTGHICLGR
jgi:hypothetical protein